VGVGAIVKNVQSVTRLDSSWAIGSSLPLSEDHCRLVARSSNKPAWYPYLKRAIDIFGALVGLTLLMPLMAAIALAVGLTSRGGIFFVQERYGLNRRLFRIYKFRTLLAHLADQSGVRQVTDDDHRLTSIGKFLRLTSLDELPQLWNVLIGDMSLVGPRPHVPGMKACGILYEELVPNYFVRNQMRPGVTGLAQVEGFRGSTEHREDAFGRVELDLLYVEQWSLLLDVKIILRTLATGFVVSSRRSRRASMPDFAFPIGETSPEID
jgi:lipopolysaccharide/colanic/teichoic acid biosynthesis glycosyltransferase